MSGFVQDSIDGLTTYLQELSDLKDSFTNESFMLIGRVQTSLQDSTPFTLPLIRRNGVLGFHGSYKISDIEIFSFQQAKNQKDFYSKNLIRFKNSDSKLLEVEVVQTSWLEEEISETQKTLNLFTSFLEKVSA